MKKKYIYANPNGVSVVRASCSTLTLYVVLNMDQPSKQNLKHLPPNFT